MLKTKKQKREIVEDLFEKIIQNLKTSKVKVIGKNKQPWDARYL